MRLMKRNQTAIYYCLYKGKEPLLDEDGNETSEYRVLYERPVKLMCSVSHATGYAQVNMFGNSKEGVSKMIDCENEVYTRIVRMLREEFPGINVAGEYTKTPSSFPHVSITQSDNLSLIHI